MIEKLQEYMNTAVVWPGSTTMPKGFVTCQTPELHDMGLLWAYSHCPHHNPAIAEGLGYVLRMAPKARLLGVLVERGAESHEKWFEELDAKFDVPRAEIVRLRYDATQNGLMGIVVARVCTVEGYTVYRVCAADGGDSGFWSCAWAGVET